jgi:hypothetical protein
MLPQIVHDRRQLADLFDAREIAVARHELRPPVVPREHVDDTAAGIDKGSSAGQQSNDAVLLVEQKHLIVGPRAEAQVRARRLAST